MKVKKRYILVGLLIGLVFVEVALRLTAGSKVLVELVNNGTAPVENLRVICNGVEAHLVRIDPGKRAGVYVSARWRTPLTMRFHQADSVVSMINFDDFDAPVLVQNHEKFVVELANDGYRPSTEDIGESEGNLAERALANIRRWLASLP
jgi:hypothetical protein